jgi:hypothetical protein
MGPGERLDTLIGTDSSHQNLTDNAHEHVTSRGEGEPTEHYPFGDITVRVQHFPNSFRQAFVVGRRVIP